jgi:hypothetical protein
MAGVEPLVEHWFGPAFALLHPQLQALHQHGGMLSGPCRVHYGTGLAGVAGRLLARRLGMQRPAGAATLCVSIRTDATALVWSRRLNDGPEFTSRFVPVGHYPSGHWLETSGAIRLRLGVAVREGAWHWEQQCLYWGPIPCPRRLMPRTVASKAVLDGLYVFCVAVHVPLLGEVFSYRGTLSLSK